MRRFIRVFGFGLFFAGFFLLPAIAAAKTEEDTGVSFGGWQWLWAFFSLILVTALAYWATKFLAGRMAVSPAKHIKVAESLLLGPNRHLYLLLVNGKVLLLGSSEHGFTLLREFDDPQLYAELEQNKTSFQIPAGRFAQLLAPIMQGIQPPGNAAATGLSPGQERLRAGLEKLRSLRDKGKRE